MKKPLRVGVIGVGAMGINHARVYSQLPDVKLIAVCDIDKMQAISIAQSYECKPYVDYNDLSNENLDAVSIVAPTTFHSEIALAVIQRGISVLVEKPIADTVEKADEMISAAKNNEVKLMVGHIERFNPAVIKLKEMINQGILGDIISISAKRVGPYNPRIRDVGIILDLGTHDIDIIADLYGENAKQVYASAGSVLHNHEDHAIIVLSFDRGSGVIETNWLTPHKLRKLNVIGSEGIAEVDYIDMTLKISNKERVREAKIEKEEPLKLELQHFINCVRLNEEPLVSGENGKHVLQVALAAVESARTGKVCEIK